ncbi:hypothetical protein SAMN05216330_102777 [Bradyrhizobium sp. Ghvi]|uniref:hypothetical protein n=1 Tax=Bradyrhizobium sp. Ghvi TaxID=1855319 RepID=UPI0008EEFE6C|nr:hypothetical protein [Bradyrhizobium sp. Ghvi]SFO34378.1 hypothetical protein SAMN05216330_102777 [Bradyrhizobium sp. Ghvi]
MTSKMPPVPPDNQSRKGTGDDKKKMSANQASRGRQRVENPNEQGQQGNIKQNTTNQGYQQDR